jgi:hypothetical protein
VCVQRGGSVSHRSHNSQLRKPLNAPGETYPL